MIFRSNFPPNAFCFGGGGRTSPAQQIAAAPVPVPAPPVTTTSAEVVQSQNDMRRQALKRRGFSKTIFAGDNGGWLPGPSIASPTSPKQTQQGGAGPGASTLGG